MRHRFLPRVPLRGLSRTNLVGVPRRCQPIGSEGGGKRAADHPSEESRSRRGEETAFDNFDKLIHDAIRVEPVSGKIGPEAPAEAGFGSSRVDWLRIEAVKVFRRGLERAFKCLFHY